MGYEMLVGPEDAETEAYYFGSNSDVTAFMDWLGSLPKDAYPLLEVFARDFQTTEPHSLSQELADARDAHAPGERVKRLIQEVGETTQDLPSGTLFRLAS